MAEPNRCVRFVGDVHQRYPEYLSLIGEVAYSVQVGDLGLEYSPLSEVDTTRHRAIAGNHDQYGPDSPDFFKNQPIFLDDFGVHEIPGMPPIFYVRGAWSIDQEWRKRKQGWPQNHRRRAVSWWPEEELGEGDLDRAVALYERARPEIVVSHECPLSIVGRVTDPRFCAQFGYEHGVIETRTNRALERMLACHRPRHYFFGHYHKAWQEEIEGTRFVCLDMLRGLGGDGAVFDWPLG